MEHLSEEDIATCMQAFNDLDEDETNDINV
jgi:hypothetical protein